MNWNRSALLALGLLVTASVAVATADAPPNGGADEILQRAVRAAQAQSAKLTKAQREANRQLVATAQGLFNKGELQAAKIGFERALALDPADGRAQYYFAETLTGMGDLVSAREHYAMAKELAPNTEEGLKAEAALAALPKGPRPASAPETSGMNSSVSVGSVKMQDGLPPVSGSGKDLYSPAFFDFMLKQRIAKGQADTPKLRQAVRDELNTRELLVREAKKIGLDQAPGVRTEMDLSVQTTLVRAFSADNPQAPRDLDSAVIKGNALYPPEYFDFLLKQRLKQESDSPKLRASLRDELNMRELLVQQARDLGYDRRPDLQTEMDLSAQTVLVRAYMAEYLKSHPVSDEALHKEYKVRHILVDNQAEAQEIIGLLQKGEKFETLAAARSNDTGSKTRGGDLDWNTPSNFVKPFGDAMVALQKGKFTTTPVQTQFGWHVIEVDDTREAKVPSFDEVKPQLSQRMQGAEVDAYLKQLRVENGY